MMRYQHKFVSLIPEDLEESVLYVSTEYATVSHLCACGCKEEVVTPLSKEDWYLIFDGVSITLKPSIGNWDFDCRSHYWIINNKVVWCPPEEPLFKNSKKSNTRKWWDFFSFFTSLKV
ncbi:hypothetical protein SAMN05661096_02916 [Marivirga sericea]|uniref:Uncharacterized protein n=1 Tax=Marivirga sericea TaxID=1028 RepID=A0A1X7KME4_9BACT|nr:DUF6527 family protein [Marivirga sericea]SMG42694.1 hypothetical protein SAMN05661096_02916 [Marivirga sericea]